MSLVAYEGKTLTGKQFNEIIGKMPIVKFMNDGDLHRGFQYQNGDNLDILPFHGSDECCAGGLYATTLLDCMNHYHCYGNYARRVRIKPDALVYVEHKKFKCDELFLEEKVPKEVLLKSLFTEYLMYLIDSGSNDTVNDFFDNILGSIPCYDIRVLEFIEPCFLSTDLLEKYPQVAQYIPSPLLTLKRLMNLIDQNCYNINFIKQELRSEELMLYAIGKYAKAIYYMDDHRDLTLDFMKKAVRVNDSLKIVYIEIDDGGDGKPHLCLKN